MLLTLIAVLNCKTGCNVLNLICSKGRLTISTGLRGNQKTTFDGIHSRLWKSQRQKQGFYQISYVPGLDQFILKVQPKVEGTSIPVDRAKDTLISLISSHEQMELSAFEASTGQFEESVSDYSGRFVR